MKPSDFYGNGMPRKKPPRMAPRPNSQTTHQSQNTFRSYDPDSGLVYSETAVSLAKQQYSWMHESKGSTPATIRSSARGTRSLAQTARSKTAASIRHLTPTHFENVPWELAEGVWEELVEFDAQSYHAWRTLASAYPSAHDFAQTCPQHLLEFRQPSRPYEHYFAQVTAAETSETSTTTTPPRPPFVTALRIPPTIATSSFLLIHTITNLCVLDVSLPPSSPFDTSTASALSERLFRSWAELAGQGAAFQQLRAALFGFLDADSLDRWIFAHLTAFPRLRYLVVTDCAAIHQRNRAEWEPAARGAGWDAKHAKRSVKLLRPELKSDERVYSGVGGLYRRALEEEDDDDDKTADADAEDRDELRPVLEVQLGNPRVWSHITDDFPGGRTVWFQRDAQPSHPAEKPAAAAARALPPTSTPASTSTSTSTSAQQRMSQPLGGADAAKRVRHADLLGQGSHSPPHKRAGRQPLVLKRRTAGGPGTRGKTVQDVLRELGA